MSKYIDLSSGLSADYEKLYESGRYMDISIHVGKESNSKIFSAHAVVLCARSKFFENNLTENAEAPDASQKAAITFEDVSPEVFEVLLRYIYTGRMSCDLCKSIGWFNLLDEASKFELVDLSAAIETYLIDEQTEWIQQNILTAHKYATSTSLNKLLAYCNRIMVSHPDIIFKSNDVATLPRKTLITLLESNELHMEEDDIWIAVVQWAIKQVPELDLGSDSVEWSSSNTNTIKDIIADCIPHIRFFNISPEKVILYEDLLPKELRRDIMHYYAKNKNYKPNTPLLPPRTGQTCMLPPKAGQGYDIDSVIINNKQAEWLSSKIVESTKQLEEDQETPMKQNNGYKLTLLYRQSRDGRTAASFRKLCSNKGPTISVGRVLDTEEILGGYNPLSWADEGAFGRSVSTDGSFLFVLDKTVYKSMTSFVNNSKFAIHENIGYFPIFGDGSSYDLYFGNDVYEPSARKSAYQFSIRSSPGSFKWADWEVFLVSRL